VDVVRQHHETKNPLVHVARKRQGLKAAAFAASALAFASLGDAFLYPFLPVNYKLAGIDVGWVGIILSVNRFVRIFSNRIMVSLFATLGLRAGMIAAVIGAILSTAGYAIAAGIVSWVALRILWGLCFSAMRIGALGYAVGSPRQGLALGVSRSLQEAGPLATLFFAPYLLGTFPLNQIFILLALCSVPALWFAWQLPKSNDRTKEPPPETFLKVPSTINCITFVSALIVDGILVVALGILFLNYTDDVSLLEASAFAAFYLAYRRVCLVVLSPGGGWLADRFGIDRIFAISAMLVITGAMMLSYGWISAGVIILFTFYSLHTAITPGKVARGENQSLNGVADNATWRDIGAAVGTLLGGVLVAVPSSVAFALSAGSFLLMLLLVVHSGLVRRFYRQQIADK
jgi:MFS transporter, DHA1 family, multidrug resistance protein